METMCKLLFFVLPQRFSEVYPTWRFNEKNAYSTKLLTKKLRNFAFLDRTKTVFDKNFYYPPQ